MRSLRAPLALSCAISLVSAVAPAGAATASPPSTRATAASTIASNVRTSRLPNGLTVVLAPDPLAQAVDIAVWYPAGTRTEPEGKSGLTHLIERLMFQGSPQYPAREHQRLLRAEGAVPGSLTHADYACFFETVAPGALDLALRLEADRMSGLELGPVKVEAARAALQDSRRARLGENAVARGLQDLFALGFQGHPYARPSIGLEADLARIQPADAQAFYRRHYGPAGTVLTVVGRFEPDAAQALVRKHFGGIRGVARAPVADTPFRPQTRERRFTESYVGGPSIAFVGWRGGRDTDADSPALEVLSVVISEGQPSRLQRALADAGLPVAQVTGDLQRGREGSLLFCVAGLSSTPDTAQVEQAIFAEVERLAREPVPEDDLERAKRHVEAQTLLDVQSTRGRAAALGGALMLDGDLEAVDRRLARVRALTAAEVRAAAAKILVPQARNTVWMLGSGTGAGGGQ